MHKLENVNTIKPHNPPDNSESKQKYFKVEEMLNKCPERDLKPTQFQDTISREDVNTTNNLSSEDTITPVKASVVIWIP